MMRYLVLILIALTFGCSSGRPGKVRELPPFFGFPSYPPIADADPSIREKRTFRVPTALDVKRTEESISISVDTNSYKEIELYVGYKMTTGFKWEPFLITNGQRASHGYGYGNARLMHFGYYINRKDWGKPMPGEEYVVEVRITIYETDKPSDHLLDPSGEKYLEIWVDTLSSAEI